MHNIKKFGPIWDHQKTLWKKTTIQKEIIKNILQIWLNIKSFRTIPFKRFSLVKILWSSKKKCPPYFLFSISFSGFRRRRHQLFQNFLFARLTSRERFAQIPNFHITRRVSGCQNMRSFRIERHGQQRLTPILTSRIDIQNGSVDGLTQIENDQTARRCRTGQYARSQRRPR